MIGRVLKTAILSPVTAVSTELLNMPKPFGPILPPARGIRTTATPATLPKSSLLPRQPAFNGINTFRGAQIACRKVRSPPLAHVAGGAEIKIFAQGRRY